MTLGSKGRGIVSEQSPTAGSVCVFLPEDAIKDRIRGRRKQRGRVPEGKARNLPRGASHAGLDVFCNLGDFRHHKQNGATIHHRFETPILGYLLRPLVPKKQTYVTGGDICGKTSYHRYPTNWIFVSVVVEPQICRLATIRSRPAREWQCSRAIRSIAWLSADP